MVVARGAGLSNTNRSLVECPSGCQSTVIAAPARQSSTRAHSHSLPSAPRSYQRPPILGSRTISAIGDLLLLAESFGSHHVCIAVAKARNARAGAAGTRTDWLTGFTSLSAMEL